MKHRWGCSMTSNDENGLISCHSIDLNQLGGSGSTVVAPQGGLGGLFPHLFPRAIPALSKFNEKILGVGWETSSKILKWVWQPNCIIVLGMVPKILPACDGWPHPPLWRHASL